VRGDFHDTREACARKEKRKKTKNKKVVDSFSFVRCHFSSHAGSPGGAAETKEKRKKKNSI